MTTELSVGMRHSCKKEPCSREHTDLQIMAERVEKGKQMHHAHFCFLNSFFPSLLPHIFPSLPSSAQQCWALTSVCPALVFPCSLPSFVNQPPPPFLNQDTSNKTESVSHVKWEVIKRKEVPKNVKQIPRAPLVLIWDTIRVVTVAYSTSGRRKRSCC